MPVAVMLTKDASPGLAKTRLGETIGPQEAAAVHEHLALWTAATLRRSGLETAISFDGSLDAPLACRLRDLGHVVFQQPKGGLGERIHHALHRSDRCVAIGSDCPLLTTTDLITAAHGMGLSLGPSEDGGYWLIAASRPPADLCRPSFARTFSRTFWRTLQNWTEAGHITAAKENAVSIPPRGTHWSVMFPKSVMIMRARLARPPGRQPRR